MQQVTGDRVVVDGLEGLEQWAPVPEAPAYDVSSWGRVRRGAFDVATWSNHKGYQMASIELEVGPVLRYVHRLMLQAFRGPGPRRGVANHLNGRKSDNRLDNLDWTTNRGNALHARRLQLQALGYQLIPGLLELPAA